MLENKGSTCERTNESKCIVINIIASSIVKLIVRRFLDLSIIVACCSFAS
jgi:hypothetical protein